MTIKLTTLAALVATPALLALQPRGTSVEFPLEAGATRSKTFTKSIELSLDDMSTTLNPRINWIMFPGAELSVTGLIFVGDTEPKNPRDYASKIKFGQKAAGRSVVSVAAKVTW